MSLEILSLIAAAAGGLLGGATGLVGELFSRFWLIRGDTHIDPPASAIWPMTTLALITISAFAA